MRPAQPLLLFVLLALAGCDIGGPSPSLGGTYRGSFTDVVVRRGQEVPVEVDVRLSLGDGADTGGEPGVQGVGVGTLRYILGGEPFQEAAELGVEGTLDGTDLTLEVFVDGARVSEFDGALSDDGEEIRGRLDLGSGLVGTVTLTRLD